MAHGKDMGYSIFRLFVVLFVLTAVEVAWGMFLREPRWLLWVGLLVCAVWKGLLILMYFMHMRFEKMIVWSLILPTPALIAIVLAAVIRSIGPYSPRDDGTRPSRESDRADRSDTAPVG